MRKAGWPLAVCAVVVGSLSSVGAEAAVANTSRCASPTVTIDHFEVGEAIGDLAIGPDGNVWFTLFEREQIGRLNPRGGKVKYFSKGITPDPLHPVTGSVAPLGITEGPDGNMWFTEYGADRIGRIEPDGTITEFSAGITPPSGAAVELGGAAPHAIVTGPDGNLWFTEELADRIGRITPDGVITEFSAGITPSPANDFYPDPHQYQPVMPTSLTTGPDGNVWFVEQMANRVGRITPDGAITEFAVPVDPPTFQFADGRPGFRTIYLNAVTPGSDGNVWFTADGAGDPIPGNSLGSGVGAVGRVTPSGEITLFTEGLSQGPTKNTQGLPPNPQPAGLRGLTEGPSKSFWALRSQGLVRVTRSGKITELPVEIEISVRGEERLVPGPRDSLWFAEKGDISRPTLSCGTRAGS